MGEGHAGNGEPEIRRLFYAFIHAECAADDERQFRMAGDGNIRKLCGKLLRRQLCPLDAERDFVAFLRERREKTVALLAQQGINLRADGFSGGLSSLISMFRSLQEDESRFSYSQTASAKNRSLMFPT